MRWKPPSSVIVVWPKGPRITRFYLEARDFKWSWLFVCEKFHPNGQMCCASFSCLLKVNGFCINFTTEAPPVVCLHMAVENINASGTLCSEVTGLSNWKHMAHWNNGLCSFSWCHDSPCNALIQRQVQQIYMHDINDLFDLSSSSLWFILKSKIQMRLNLLCVFS